MASSGSDTRKDYRRASRSVGASRNKTRIEKILSQQKELKAKPQGKRAERKKLSKTNSQKMTLVSSIVEGIGKKEVDPQFFGNSALKTHNSAFWGNKNKYARPRSNEKPRPRSEEIPRRKHKTSTSTYKAPTTSSLVQWSDPKPEKGKAAYRTNSGSHIEDMYLQLELELGGNESSSQNNKKVESKVQARVSSCPKKIKKGKGKGGRTGSRNGKQSSRKGSASGKEARSKELVVSETSSVDAAQSIDLRQIEEMQEKNRLELEQYLFSLSTKTDLDGKPLAQAVVAALEENKTSNKDKGESNLSILGKSANLKEDGEGEADTSKALIPSVQSAKPLNVKKILKKIEKEFALTYPAYDGTVVLRDGQKVGKVSVIDDFGARIDELLTKLGDIGTMGGTGMGFVPLKPEQESLDKLDVRLEKLRAMKPNSRPSEISNKAKMLLKKLKSEKNNFLDGDQVLATGRTLMTELSSGMSTVQSGDIEISPAVVRRLVDEGKRELGKTFLTQGSSSDLLETQRRGKKKGPSRKMIAPPEEKITCKTLDPEIEETYGGYSNLMQALKKGQSLKDYHPEVDLTRRRIEGGLNHLDHAIELLQDSEFLKKSFTQACAPESHKDQLANSKDLPPIRDPRQLTPRLDASSTITQSRIQEIDNTANGLVTKMKNLMGNMDKKMRSLKEQASYDL
mmetsp:Transcript_25013/g.34825  ORF Transcript_25013/g.34825 Transcript_25013/m.34825 type:complete len:681 (+) Transcript_25013:295-2337(+)|eukprot:CAMPEP_0184491138 /NCGR_PEP_ID=MMETSP0113_2-20130426/19683_1 /TAXON_ID=91329 /ORGANISM="Norrisiella sphaerica, Strain BC52" /LENGTH=680 /DNA_ID=CAMNT_0026875373 /DNA_START=205 /DNA_END=2247 /DNA_ORIENTATION=-